MSADLDAVLDRCFFGYRAEYLQDSLEELFVRPPYLDKLRTAQPCFLFGGRGTGKTTTLRSLSYSTDLPFEEHRELGIYIRVNKNQVYPFDSDRHQELLRRAFAHYFNLIAAREFSRLLLWLGENGAPAPPPEAIETLSIQLCIQPSINTNEFLGHLERAIIELGAFVNNVDQEFSSPPRLSTPEAPVSALARLVNEIDPHSRLVMCCIDEYENLLDWEQAVLNGYIKHAEPPLTYKIGLKANGLRNRDTIVGGDPLVTPADYIKIDIADESGDDFFPEVLRRRLKVAKDAGAPLPDDPNVLLPALNRRDEAEMLGAKRIADSVRAEINGEGSENAKRWAQGIGDGDLYIVAYRAVASDAATIDLAESFASSPNEWTNVVNNHGFASLFWLSRGRRGVRFRKHYAGVDTFLRLAGGNVRFFLELAGFAIRRGIDSSDITDESHSLPAQTQTLAAREVAQSQLEQLDGVGGRGSELKRLVLGIGKVFFELTRRPEGKVPEPSTFVLSGNEESIAQMHTLLREGVAYLAFIAAPRTKATSDSEIRDDEYGLHPIFAPFFEMSYRRKRRITLNADHLLELQANPQATLKKLLKDDESTPAEDLPEQLAMFAGFYEG
jgi:hypothetical protein